MGKRGGAIHTFAVIDDVAPDGVWLWVSDSDALKFLGEVTVRKHEARMTPRDNGVSKRQVSSFQISIHWCI